MYYMHSPIAGCRGEESGSGQPQSAVARVPVVWVSMIGIQNPGLGQIHWMCTQVGLEVKAIRRIRIGRIPLKQMVLGPWRYLPEGEAF